MKRHLGAPGPPAASATTQVSTITGSTRRSRLRSIGSEALSNTPLNGTSQSMAMKPAIIHGSSRVVCGQSSRRGRSRSGVVASSGALRRRVDTASPAARAAAVGLDPLLQPRRTAAISAARPQQAPKTTANVSAAIFHGAVASTGPPRAAPS